MGFSTKGRQSPKSAKRFEKVRKLLKRRMNDDTNRGFLLNTSAVLILI